MRLEVHRDRVEVEGADAPVGQAQDLHAEGHHHLALLPRRDAAADERRALRDRAEADLEALEAVLLTARVLAEAEEVDHCQVTLDAAVDDRTLGLAVHGALGLQHEAGRVGADVRARDDVRLLLGEPRREDQDGGRGQLARAGGLVGQDVDLVAVGHVGDVPHVVEAREVPGVRFGQQEDLGREQGGGVVAGGGGLVAHSGLSVFFQFCRIQLAESILKSPQGPPLPRNSVEGLATFLIQEKH